MSITQYELPLYDPKNISISPYELCINKADGCQFLANADNYNFSIGNLRNLFIYSEKRLTGISDVTAKELFLEWCNQYKGCLWRPINRITRKAIERYDVQLVSPREDIAFRLKNVSQGSNPIETGDKLYAIPPLFSIVRETNHTFKIKNKEHDIFVQPMLFTEKDYEDLKFDIALSIMNPNYNLQLYGKSFLKNHLTTKDMVQLIGYLSSIRPIGIVYGPVVPNPNGSIMGYIGAENKISPCQQFYIKFWS